MFNKLYKINIFYQKRLKFQLIRPLIKLNRVEILKLCLFWSLPISLDKTNKLLRFRRNRLRYQIFPILRTFFNPKLDRSLINFINLTKLDKYYLNKQFIQTNNFFHNSKRKNKILKSKWFFYLPLSLSKKVYNNLLVSHFKQLSFDEICYLLKLNSVY